MVVIGLVCCQQVPAEFQDGGCQRDQRSTVATTSSDPLVTGGEERGFLPGSRHGDDAQRSLQVSVPGSAPGGFDLASRLMGSWAQPSPGGQSTGLANTVMSVPISARICSAPINEIPGIRHQQLPRPLQAGPRPRCGPNRAEVGLDPCGKIGNPGVYSCRSGPDAPLPGSRGDR